MRQARPFLVCSLPRSVMGGRRPPAVGSRGTRQRPGPVTSARRAGTVLGSQNLVRILCLDAALESAEGVLNEERLLAEVCEPIRASLGACVANQRRSSKSRLQTRRC